MPAHTFLAAVAAALAQTVSSARAAARPPDLRHPDDAAQLFLDGKPFLMLGGELGNSSRPRRLSLSRDAGEILGHANGARHRRRNARPANLDQGRELLMDARTVHLYRVRLYCYDNDRRP